MGIIDHNACAVLFGELADLRQLCDAAAHGKDAVRNDQAAFVRGDLLQAAFQFLHVVVMVAEHLAPAQFGCIVNRSVIFSVEDHIIIAANQRADDPEVGLESGGEGDNSFFMKEVCKLFFQFLAFFLENIGDTF